MSPGLGGKDKASIAWLASAAAQDPAALTSVRGPLARNIGVSRLDARSHALVCLAAVVTLGGRGSAVECELRVSTALDLGVTPDEIVGVLVALLPTVGTERIVAAAPAVLRALTGAVADLR